jgi:hypothetical protein
MRRSERLPYFVSGVGYPDYVILDEKPHAAGFFGPDWGLAEGEFAEAK